jgi:hypothetical protein
VGVGARASLWTLIAFTNVNWLKHRMHAVVPRWGCELDASPTVYVMSCNGVWPCSNLHNVGQEETHLVQSGWRVGV